MTAESEIQSMGLMLGELKGQMRELIHNVNNLSAKLDAIALQAARNSHLPEEIDKLKSRVTILEGKENQRTGAINMGGWLMRTPLIGWVATAAIAAWAFLSGKVGQ